MPKAADHNTTADMMEEAHMLAANSITVRLRTGREAHCAPAITWFNSTAPPHAPDRAAAC
jgi:hypothetical protein